MHLGWRRHAASCSRAAHDDVAVTAGQRVLLTSDLSLQSLQDS